MKKFLVPLFFALLFSCSSDGFKSDIAASAQKDIWCWVLVENECINKQISKILCDEIGVPYDQCPAVSSSSDEEISSSSRNTVSSSSRNTVSSSSRNAVSSSSGGAVSSSSGDDVSSSSDDDVSSSSGDDVSSNSGGVGSSSSGVAGSSSGGAVSSSSIGNSSSSSIGVSSSSSLVPPSLGDCSTFPSYVSKAKKESLKGLVSVEHDYERCGDVTYSAASNNFASITGDSISFASAPASSSTRTLNITARVTCTGFTVTPKTCPPIEIEVIGDKYAKIETCDNPRVNVGPGSTIVEITCLKEDGSPAKEFGCDKPSGSDDFGPNNVFTLNKTKAGPNTTSWNSGWASVALPPALAAKENKRVLIEYNGGTMGCVAY